MRGREWKTRRNFVYCSVNAVVALLNVFSSFFVSESIIRGFFIYKRITRQDDVTRLSLRHHNEISYLLLCRETLKIDSGRRIWRVPIICPRNGKRSDLSFFLVFLTPIFCEKLSWYYGTISMKNWVENLKENWGCAATASVHAARKHIFEAEPQNKNRKKCTLIRLYFWLFFVFSITILCNPHNKKNISFLAFASKIIANCHEKNVTLQPITTSYRDISPVMMTTSPNTSVYLKSVWPGIGKAKVTFERGTMMVMASHNKLALPYCHVSVWYKEISRKFREYLRKFCIECNEIQEVKFIMVK